MHQPTKLSIIFAGEDFTATLLDNSTVPVRVRAMPVRHLGRVLQLADHEAELLDFLCTIPKDGDGWAPVPAGWADNLTDTTHVQLYEAAKRLNFSRAATWAERQIAAKQFSGEIALKAEEMLQPMMQQIVNLVTSSLPRVATPASPATAS